MWRVEIGLPLCKDAVQILSLAKQDVHKQQTENYFANVVLQELMCHTKNQQRYKKLCFGESYDNNKKQLISFGAVIFQQYCVMQSVNRCSLHSPRAKLTSI